MDGDFRKMNLKKYVYGLLSGNSELTSLIGSSHVLSSYPQEVTTFPLVVFEDMFSSDVAFSDNLPEGTSAQVRIHIFSKTIKNYAKVEDIAEIIRSIFRSDFWAMTNNTDTADVEDNTRHRIMDFRREFYSL
jgi:hypothetical protein